jgi:hypothetical protein
VDPKDQEAIEGETPRALQSPLKPKFKGRSVLTIGALVAVAMVGVFVVVVVLFGDSNAVTN